MSPEVDVSEGDIWGFSVAVVSARRVLAAVSLVVCREEQPERTKSMTKLTPRML
jgi:hypothetical protein